MTGVLSRKSKALNSAHFNRLNLPPDFTCILICIDCTILPAYRLMFDLCSCHTVLGILTWFWFYTVFWCRWVRVHCLVSFDSMFVFPAALLHTERLARRPLPIYKVLVRSGRESNSRPTSTETDALTWHVKHTVLCKHVLKTPTSSDWLALIRLWANAPFLNGFQKHNCGKLCE